MTETIWCAGGLARLGVGAIVVVAQMRPMLVPDTF